MEHSLALDLHADSSHIDLRHLDSSHAISTPVASSPVSSPQLNHSQTDVSTASRDLLESLKHVAAIFGRIPSRREMAVADWSKSCF